MIIAEKTEITKYSTQSYENSEDLKRCFFIHLKITGEGSEFLDYKLPTPSYQKFGYHNSVFYGWALNGYFGTHKAQEFLKDIQQRLLYTFTDYKPEILPFKPDLKARKSQIFLRSYELKEFSTRLESIKHISRVELNIDSYKDQVFWELKIYAEIRIKENGIFSYDELLEFGEYQCLDRVKDYSTLRAKCKSIFNWYLMRDFEIGRQKSERTAEEIMATRQEKLSEARKIKTERALTAIKVAINALQEQNKLYKPNGKPNLSLIERTAGISRETVRKYIGDFI